MMKSKGVIMSTPRNVMTPLSQRWERQRYNHDIPILFALYIKIFSRQQEKCEENFKKSCYIDFVETPRTHEVEECNTNLTRNCDITGEEVCTDEFETGNTS